MKCAHPTCNRGIGLASHRRGWFGKRRYCSRTCCDNHAAERRKPLPPQAPDASLVALLFALPSPHRFVTGRTRPSFDSAGRRAGMPS